MPEQGGRAQPDSPAAELVAGTVSKSTSARFTQAVSPVSVSGGFALIDTFSLDPKQTLMVGDTSHDAEVARELGVDCVLIAQGHQAIERLENQGCIVVDSLDSLLSVLSPELDRFGTRRPTSACS